jgi:hypothetical protein
MQNRNAYVRPGKAGWGIDKRPRNPMAEIQ